MTVTINGTTGLATDSTSAVVEAVSLNHPSSSTAAITMDASNNVTLASNLTMTSGIYLGGTGSANLLDDYEEGTWTPTVVVGSLTSYADAIYRKIGNLVYLYVAGLRFSDTSTASTIEIGGRPFTPSHAAIGSVMLRYGGSSTVNYASFTSESTDYISFPSSNNSASWVYLQHSNLSIQGVDLNLSIMYSTA